jgi:hypothetical protein
MLGTSDVWKAATTPSSSTQTSFSQVFMGGQGAKFGKRKEGEKCVMGSDTQQRRKRLDD